MKANKSKKIYLWLVTLMSLYSAPSWAQTQGGADYFGRSVTTEIGFHLGQLLPNQIPNVREILGLWGIRGGFRIGTDGFSEFGFIGGNSENTTWNNAYVSLRLDLPVEMLVGFVYIGADAIQYQVAGSDPTSMGSGHVGGGIQSLIADAVWFRGDMKFNVNPGTSMYLGFGFTFRF